jgi:class 3 adenylate cyclase/pimeloyl-ACP methyl ester carboxylesterase
VLGVPEISFVSIGDADLGYQVFGEGPIDFVFFWGLGSHLVLHWDIPGVREMFDRMSSACRVILLDRRGTGVSDALPQGQMPTWEFWAEDLTAVLDAVGSERTALMGVLDCGPLAIQYAATHPGRVHSLVLGGTAARFLAAEDYPIGLPAPLINAIVRFTRQSWGTPEGVRALNPRLQWDAELLAAWTRLLSSAATPRSAAMQLDYVLSSLDVRAALSLVQAPTLILQYSEGLLTSMDMARYMADRIQGARLIELPGSIPAGLSTAEFGLWIADVIELVTGERPPADIDRVLTTVLFTDIVGSTHRAARVGDQEWRKLLDHHDRVVRDELRRFKGKEVNTTGDGFVMSFDGPARAVRCAQAILQATAPLGLELRIGLHTGECEIRGEDLGGLAVHISARVGAAASPGEILVSSTLKDLVMGSGIEFTERGEHTLKGVPGSWKLYGVTG